MGKGESGLYSGTAGSEKQELHPELEVNEEQKQEADSPASSPSSFNGCREATGFLSKEKLEKHYSDHKGEFSKNITKEQYVEKAKRFFESKVTDNTLYSYDADNILFKYDKKTNEFGMCNSEGGIITYFKPKKREKYWQEQAVRYYL